MRPKVVVVNGYGCHLRDELRIYLGKVASHVLRESPDLVVFSGGQTQQHTAPGMSEAHLMSDYLCRALGVPPKDQTHDSDSYTTYENVRNAAQIIRDYYQIRRSEPVTGFCDVTIFCEATRALKVAILARHFFGFPPVRIETVSWELMDPRKELMSTVYDTLSLRFPWLAERWRRKRMERARSI